MECNHDSVIGCIIICWLICLVLTPSGENSDLKEFEKQANKVEMVDTESETEESETEESEIELGF